MGDLLPPGFAGFGWSFVLGIVLLGVVWGGLIVGILVHAWRLARLQDHENRYMHERATWRLLPGPSRVVHGRVQVEDARDVAIEIDIEQRVEDHTNKNQRWHTWNELSRRTEAHPFKLERDGEMVLVEPGQDVFVVDALVTEYPESWRRRRVRAARVRQGEEVFVYGDLHGMSGGGVYRGGTSFVLRPPPAGRLLVATEAMRDRYRARIRYLRNVGALLALAWAVLNLVNVPFAVAALFGTQETATLTNLRHYTTRGKNGPIQHYEMTVRAPDGFTLEQDVPRETFARAQALEPPVSVPLLRTGQSSWTSFLGTEPGIPVPLPIVALTTALVLTLLAFVNYQKKVAWYDQKRLNEHGGSGHWVEGRRG